MLNNSINSARCIACVCVCCQRSATSAPSRPQYLTKVKTVACNGHTPTFQSQVAACRYRDMVGFYMHTQVHAYVQAAAGRTAYLSELASGCEVLVADATGAQMTAIVGRVKIESRPLVRAGA